MLTVSHLGYQLNDRWILRDVDFTLVSGQCLHICGPNGVGKSTLLKLLVGLFPPTKGTITWQGQSLRKCWHEYQQQLSYLGHRLAIKPRLTVAEQLGECPQNIIETNGLSDILHVMGEVLSAGQQQRVALARLMSRQAPLWVLDEPLTALDQPSIDRLSEALNLHCQQGGSVILSSHQTLTLPGVAVMSYLLKPLAEGVV